MPLKELVFTPKNITKGLDVIRNMPSLERLGTADLANIPAAEFWKRYDTGEFNNP